LHVLGNGQQRKSYLYVGDCLDAILLAMDKSTGPVDVFNLGTDEFCKVKRLDWLDHRPSRIASRP